MRNDADSVTEPDEEIPEDLLEDDSDAADDSAASESTSVFAEVDQFDDAGDDPDAASLDPDATAAIPLVGSRAIEDDLDEEIDWEAWEDDGQPDAGDPDADDMDFDDAGSDDAVLFDGDPDDFELGFGVAPAMVAPSQLDPAPGDMLVIDDPRAPAPVPRRGRPMSRAERRRRVRLQARRVRRIVRHIEPWSVLKISLVFWACLWLIFLVAGFMIWGVAESSGTVGKVEDLITDLFALNEFTFDAAQIFRGYALGGLALAIAGTTFNVLMCLLFNLISDLTGGLRITMIEEESARPAPPRRRRRRAPVRR